MCFFKWCVTLDLFKTGWVALKKSLTFCEATRTWSLYTVNDEEDIVREYKLNNLKFYSNTKRFYSSRESAATQMCKYLFARSFLCTFRNEETRLCMNTAVKRLRMRELLSELSFQLVQRLRKSISLSAFIKLYRKKGKQNYEGVNTRKLSFHTRKILRNSLPYIFRCFLIFCVSVQSALLCIQFAFIFPALF